eukprot:g9961.t1
MRADALYDQIPDLVLFLHDQLHLATESCGKRLPGKHQHVGYLCRGVAGAEDRPRKVFRASLRSSTPHAFLASASWFSLWMMQQLWKELANGISEGSGGPARSVIRLRTS